MNTEDVAADHANEHYPPFSRRAAGFLIDAVLLATFDMLVMFSSCAMFNAGPLMVALTTGTCAGFLYRPVCHGKWGMTFGKKSCHMRVLRTDRRPVSFALALLREILEFPGFLLGIAALVMVVRQTPEIESAIDYKHLVSSVYRESFPTLLNVLLPYGFIMLVLEIGCVVLHPKRRALHDLIAGTVVVYTPKPQPISSGESTPEAFTCLECGEVIPLGESTCLSCGWSYRD